MATTTTFSYTGSVQTWVCPTGVTTVTIEGWGAEGGDGTGAKGLQVIITYAIPPH